MCRWTPTVLPYYTFLQKVVDGNDSPGGTAYLAQELPLSGIILAGWVAGLCAGDSGT